MHIEMYRQHYHKLNSVAIIWQIQGNNLIHGPQVIFESPSTSVGLEPVSLFLLILHIPDTQKGILWDSVPEKLSSVCKISLSV